jgi:nascent polypeptide-associated complex subunit alpha
MAETKPTTEAPKTEPTPTEPAKTEPAKTEPAKTEPAKTEPAKTEEAPKTTPKVEEPMPDLESATTGAKKPNKSEKKCKKALSKLGMKPVAGINRVTLKRKDGCIFSINNPEVLKSGTHDNCFVVFGEMKLDDPNLRMSQKEAKQYTEPVKEEKKEEVKKEETKKEGAKEVPDTEEPLSDEGIDKSNLEMVITHTKCTRNQAIKALRETKGDVVSAIMMFTK